MSGQQVLGLLALLAEQSGENVSSPRLNFIARRLLEFNPVDVCKALERLLDSARRFPTVAEIRQEMGMAEPTPKDEAMLLADTIITAISRYGSLSPGHTQGALAIEKAIGPAAWEVVIRSGGWNAVIDRAGENLGVLRAQLRDVAESYFRTGILERGQVPLSLPSHSEALQAVREDPRLIEHRANERQKKLEAELASAKTRRQLLLMQSEHDSAKEDM